MCFSGEVAAPGDKFYTFTTSMDPTAGPIVGSIGTAGGDLTNRDIIYKTADKTKCYRGTTPAQPDGMLILMEEIT